MSRQHFEELQERALDFLPWLIAACALALIGGGLDFKSTGGWRDLGNGRGMSWSDGAKPWAVVAVLGGVSVLAMVIAGARNGRWTLAGIASIAIFAAAAMLATNYRRDLNTTDRYALYDHMQIAAGLSIVQIAGAVGAVSSALLVIISVWGSGMERRHREPAAGV